MNANTYLAKKERIRKFDIMLDLMKEQMKQLESTMEAARKAAEEDLGEDFRELDRLEKNEVISTRMR